MEDTLKRLLDAEQHARTRIENAERERDQIIEQARQEARDAETGFERRMDELRQSKFEHSDEQAEQEIAELEREHDQQLKKLAEQTQHNRRVALQQTLDWLLDPENP